MQDILSFLYNKNPFSVGSISSVVLGTKSVAIMRNDGNIGVCSTLGRNIYETPENILINPNFNKYDHRIVVNAWINASVNYKWPISGKLDINEAVDFSEFKNIVMVGYFGSLAKRMQENGVNPIIFDLDEEDKPVEPMRNQQKMIKNAQCIVLTATTLANSTYHNIMNSAPNDCKIFILGPSAPLTPQIFTFPKIAGVFGMRFKPFDFDTLKLIAEGGGTRSFLNRVDKVYLT